MNDTDRDALERALTLTLAEPDRKEQVQRMLAEDWERAATFAAYHQQSNALKLRPWESPPCFDDDSPLREKLLAAGLSRWEPSPLEALRK